MAIAEGSRSLSASPSSGRSPSLPTPGFPGATSTTRSRQIEHRAGRVGLGGDHLVLAAVRDAGAARRRRALDDRGGDGVGGGGADAVHKLLVPNSVLP